MLRLYGLHNLHFNDRRMREAEVQKHDRSLLEQVLRQAGATNTHRSAICCPFHEDRRPSGSIRQSAAGNWYFYCYACDIADDVWALRARTSGMSIAEVLKNTDPFTILPTFDRQRMNKKTGPAAGYCFIDDQHLQQCYENRFTNNLALFLFAVFPDHSSQAIAILARYCIGAVRQSFVLFPYIGLDGRCSYPKLMPYPDPHTGRGSSG